MKLLKRRKPIAAVDQEGASAGPSLTSFELTFSEDQYEEVSDQLKSLTGMLEETRRLMAERKLKKPEFAPDTIAVVTDAIGRIPLARVTSAIGVSRERILSEYLKDVSPEPAEVEVSKKEELVKMAQVSQEIPADLFSGTDVTEERRPTMPEEVLDVKAAKPGEIPKVKIERARFKEGEVSAVAFMGDNIDEEAVGVLTDIMQRMEDAESSSSGDLSSMDQELRELATAIIQAYGESIAEKDPDKFRQSLLNAVQSMFIRLAHPEESADIDDKSEGSERDRLLEKLLLDISPTVIQSEGGLTNVQQLVSGLKKILRRKSQLQKYMLIAKGMRPHRQMVEKDVALPYETGLLDVEDKILQEMTEIVKEHIVTHTSDEISVVESVAAMSAVVSEISKILDKGKFPLMPTPEKTTTELSTEMVKEKEPTRVDKERVSEKESIERRPSKLTKPKIGRRGEQKKEGKPLLAEDEASRTARRTSFFESLLRPSDLELDAFDDAKTLTDMVSEINKLIGQDRAMDLRGSLEELADRAKSTIKIDEQSESEDYSAAIEIHRRQPKTEVVPLPKVKAKKIVKKDERKPIKKRVTGGTLKKRRKPGFKEPSVRKTLFESVMSRAKKTVSVVDQAEDLEHSRRFTSQASRWLEGWESMKEELREKASGESEESIPDIDDIENILNKSRVKKRFHETRERLGKQISEIVEEAEQLKRKETELLSVSRTSIGGRITLDGLIQKLAGLEGADKLKKRIEIAVQEDDPNIRTWINENVLLEPMISHSAISLWTLMKQDDIDFNVPRGFEFRSYSIGKQFLPSDADVHDARVSNMYNRNVFLSIVRDNEVDATDPLACLTMSERRHLDAVTSMRLIEENLKLKDGYAGYQPTWTRDIHLAYPFKPIRKLNISDDYLKLDVGDNSYTGKTIRKLIMERQDALHEQAEGVKTGVPTKRYSPKYLLKYLHMWTTAKREIKQEAINPLEIDCPFPAARFGRLLSGPFYSYFQLPTHYRQKMVESKEKQYRTITKLI